MLKKNTLILLFVVICLFLTSCSKTTFRGKITDKATGEAIEGVKLTLKVDEIESTPVLSNQRGDYRIAKERTKTGLLTAEKEGFETYSVDQIIDQTELNFWLRPSVEETARRILSLEIAGIEDDKKWEELFRIYLHPYYQAEYPIQIFLEKEKDYQTFYSLILNRNKKFQSLFQTFLISDFLPNTDILYFQTKVQNFTALISSESFTVKSIEDLGEWRDEHQHKNYKNIKKITLEIILFDEEKMSKIDKNLYMVLANDYWHFFWVER